MGYVQQIFSGLSAVALVNLAKQSGGFRRVRQQLKKRTTMDNYIDFQRFSADFLELLLKRRHLKNLKRSANKFKEN